VLAMTTFDPWWRPQTMIAELHEDGDGETEHAEQGDQ
jgi:hypothetical protein